MRRVALVVAKRGDLVLFGRRNDSGKMTLPGGHLEDGEDPEAGARRELLEETGLAPTGEMKLIDERKVGDLKIYTYECDVEGAPTGTMDPDHECSVWSFHDILDGVPKAMAENLAGPKDADKNVVKDVYGVDLKKAELPLRVAFRHRSTGVVHVSNVPSHDFMNAPRDWETREIEPGWLDPQGTFLTHQEAMKRTLPQRPLKKADINPVPGRIVDYTHRTWPNLQDAGYTLTVRHEPSTKSLHADVRQHGKSVGSMVAEYQHPGQIGPAGHDLSDPELVENAHQALKHRAGTLQHEIDPKDLTTALQGLVDLNKSDSPQGYKFKVDTHGDNTVVNAYPPVPAYAGEHVGTAELWHHPEGHLVPEQVWVHEGHRRQGIASEMYRLAQEHTGKKIVRSPNQTPDGQMLWQGMAKSEEHDEVDRLLLHPDAAERHMALKLDGVAERHLIRALQDEDKTVRRAAFRHPHFGKHSMNALMRMKDRKPLQHMALGRDDVTPEHLEALYDTHKGRPAHEKAAILHAISHHGALGPHLIERMFAEGNGVPLVENLKTPTHIAHQIIEQHLLDPDNDQARSMARRALQRPDVDPALVGRAFTEGRPDVKLAAAGAPNLPHGLVRDALTRGQLSTHDHEADLRLALLARGDATREHHEHASRDRNNLVREKALRHLQPEAMKKFEADVSAWIGESLQKATKPQHFAGIVRASTQEGRDLVDHVPDLTAHPPEHGGDVQAYRHAILESPKVVEREKHANKDNGITKKVIYQVPATHPTNGGVRYMIKPYHERTPKRWDHLGKNHHFGWAEMTNQALYHAGGIGHLHQNVHVAEHNMGNDFPKEPAVVVKMEPGMDVIHHAPQAHKYATPEVKADARKIALLDFLSNNTDRHSGNVLINVPARAPLSDGGYILPNAYDRVMAIDHGRSFQYARALGSPINRKDQDDELDDNLNQYVRGSGLEQLAPLEDFSLSPYERDMESRRSWQPAVDWWGQNSDKIKAAMSQRLDQIKHPGVRAHIQRNFDARARHLDDLARWGLNNFGSKWAHTSVRLYRPGEEE